jgi:hypothetical protein
MGQAFNSWIVGIVRPPLIVLRFIFSSIHSLLFAWWLDARLVKRSNERFAKEITENLQFLFTYYNARIIPNDREPPPSFDFAMVTIATSDLLFRFLRGRGDLGVHVAPQRAPNDWHELSLVLSVIDVREGFERRSVYWLSDVARWLTLYIDRIEKAFSESRYPETKQRLDDVYRYDRAVTRRWETEINRKLSS